jgi:hypothetical protein
VVETKGSRTNRLCSRTPSARNTIPSATSGADCRRGQDEAVASTRPGDSFSASRSCASKMSLRVRLMSPVGRLAAPCPPGASQPFLKIVRGHAR